MQRAQPDPGRDVTAIVKASDVMLGVAD